MQKVNLVTVDHLKQIATLKKNLQHNNNHSFTAILQVNLR